MAITVLRMGRPNSIFMDRTKSSATKKAEYVRKGSWDWTGLSKEEMMAELLEAAKQADIDYKNGKYRPVEEFFKEWDKERAKCAVSE